MSGQRGTTTRLFAATLVGWLFLVTAAPLAVHQCPMHSAGGGASEATSDTSAMPGMAHHAPNSSTPAHHSNQCSCPGDCAAAVTALAVGSATVTLPNPVVRRAPRSIATAATTIQRCASRLLPFPNGPPAVS